MKFGDDVTYEAFAAIVDPIIASADCSTILPNITVQIEYVSYTIPSASYATVDENCKVSASYLLDVNVRDVVIVGLPFYENYVAVYDYDVKKIRLGLNVNAVEGASINADAHWDPVIKKL